MRSARPLLLIGFLAGCPTTLDVIPNTPADTSEPVDTDPDADADTDADADSDTDTDTDSDSDADSDADADADSDADSDADADADSDADSDADADADVLISEVCDHATIADAKYVEIANTGSTSVDLASWSIRRYANGATGGAALAPLSGVMPPGAVWVVASSESAFVAAFPAVGVPDFVNGTAISGNGDDVYELYDGSQVVDVYGEVGVDGTGTPWEYTDGVARRNTGITTPSDVFAVGEWTITSGEADATPGVR